jgi:8-oxo-dGTP pyrophosphatase MutT (NUDIX family)
VIEAATWPERVQRRLARGAVRPRSKEPSVATASVLVVLLEGDGVPELLLERRAEHLTRHAGQYALPGGRIDTVDHGPEDAALREAEEETGLPGDSVTLLGRLSDRRTSTGWLITPVVGVAPDPGRLVADAGEVAELIRLPATAVVGATGFCTAVRRQAGLRVSDLALEWQGRRIWGATARILRELGRVLDEVRGPWS